MVVIQFLLYCRNEIKNIILEMESQLETIRHSEISLNVNNETANEVVSLDLREQVFDAISTIKEKLGLTT